MANIYKSINFLENFDQILIDTFDADTNEILLSNLSLRKTEMKLGLPKNVVTTIINKSKSKIYTNKKTKKKYKFIKSDGKV